MWLAVQFEETRMVVLKNLNFHAYVYWTAFVKLPNYRNQYLLLTSVFLWSATSNRTETLYKNVRY